MANMLSWLLGQEAPVDPWPFRAQDELKPYYPTPSEQVGNWIQDALMAGGAKAYPAGHVAHGVRDILSMSPLGIGMSAADLAHAKAAGDPAGAAAAAIGMIPGAKPEIAAVRQGIRAFHGSPHNFDRFDISKIGTGEGNQTFGHGLYFAENPEVARNYRDALEMRRGGPSHPAWEAPESSARSVLDAYAGDTEKAIAEIEKRREAIRGLDPHFRAPNSEEKFQSVLDVLRQGKPIPGGKMYQVNINANPEQFLDWDKSWKDLSPHVREAIEKINPDLIINPVNTEGGDIYHKLAGGMLGVSSDITPKGAVRTSALLQEAGIPGIKYLDQGSRNRYGQFLDHEFNRTTGMHEVFDPTTAAVHGSFPTREAAENFIKNNKPTSNYVLFNDKIIDILKKYGIAGAFAPTVALPLSQGESWSPKE